VDDTGSPIEVGDDLSSANFAVLKNRELPELFLKRQGIAITPKKWHNTG